MGLCVLNTRAFVGIQAVPVRVEVHLANGLPQFCIVGLPDAEVRESRERVRSALVQSGFEFPAKRITVNLAPADLPKGSGRFDLPIALGIAAANGQLPNAALDDWEFAGELSLSGLLLPGKGAVAMAVSVRMDPDAQRRKLMLPLHDAARAARVDELSVYGAPTLLAAASHLVGHGEPLGKAVASPAVQTSAVACLSEVRGHAAAKRALEVAAAGVHNVLMSGPPGSGKSMLASRLTGILPPLSREHTLESAAIASLKGQDCNTAGQRPFRAPHHSASVAAIVGGGC